MWGENNPAYQVLSLMDSNAKFGLKYATLAFVISGGGCSINTFADDMISDIKAFIGVGGKLRMSFGGANGPYLEDACTDVTQIVSLIDGLIQRTGVYDLDFDVEGAYVAQAYQVVTDRRNAAIKQLQSKYSQLTVSLTLPVMPPVPEW